MIPKFQSSLESSIDILDKTNLRWYPELGIGYYAVNSPLYAKEYWLKYCGYDATEVGKNLTYARINWVANYWQGDICDVGIGAGLFCKTVGCFGYDVNQFAVDWLHENNMWQNPYKDIVDCITCWDSLEHILNPAALLRNVKKWVFLSIPIFTGQEHVLRSKHFRRDEHYWYFTRPGLVRFMQMHGFEFVQRSEVEKQWREDIETFAFCRNEKIEE